MENKILCRKCGGPHFTIKCGKEKKEEPVTVEPDTKQHQTDTKSREYKPRETRADGDREYKPREPRADGDREYKHREPREPREPRADGDREYKHREPRADGDREYKPRADRKYFKITYRVKLSELPLDMTEEELMELTTDWGHIVRIKLLVYTDNSTAYIDFGYEEEADYFVEAIDKTPLEYKLLTACRVESFRADKPNENGTEA